MSQHTAGARCPRCARALQKIRSRSAPVPMTDGSHVVRAVCVHADCGAELVVRQPPCALGPPEITLLAHFVTRLDERSHRARRVIGVMVAACIFAVPTVSAARCLSSMTMYEASLAWVPVPVITLLSGIALGLLALAAVTDASQERRLLLGLVDGALAAPSGTAVGASRAPSRGPYRTSLPDVSRVDEV